MLDYHLHLWPHTRARDAAATGAAGRRTATRAQAAGVTELAVTEHLFRFRQAEALLGGFWDDEPAPPLLAESMAEYWDFHATADLDALRGVRAGGQGRPACPSSSGSRSTTTRAAWTTVADLLAGYPFDVLLGSVHWVGAWRFDDIDDPVSMAEWSVARGRRLLGRLHRGARGAGRLGRLRRAGPPRPDQGGGPRARRARPSGGTASPRRRWRRAWRPRSPRPAGASRWASSTRPWRCSSASWPAACRSRRPRTPTGSSTWPTGPTTCAACSARPGSATLQGYRGRRAYRGARVAGPRRRGGEPDAHARRAGPRATPTSSPRSSSTCSGCSGAGASWPTSPSPTCSCWSGADGRPGAGRARPGRWTTRTPSWSSWARCAPNNRPTLVDQDLVGQTVNESQWTLVGPVPALGRDRPRQHPPPDPGRAGPGGEHPGPLRRAHHRRSLLRVSLAPLKGPTEHVRAHLPRRVRAPGRHGGRSRPSRSPTRTSAPRRRPGWATASWWSTPTGGSSSPRPTP